MPRVREMAGIGVVIVALWVFSRGVLDFRARSAVWSALLGVAVFVVWVAPDWLSAEYRHSILFENPLTGAARSSLSGAARQDPVTLAMRTFRAVALVPIAEELFWRGWLMRWLVAPEFSRVGLGVYRPFSFALTAILFASEHGPYWDVGLITGIIFNLWMIRQKTLGDMFIAHASANACLSAYVIAFEKWEYWL